MQSNTTNATIKITLNSPLSKDWKADVGKELESLSPFAFFPVCGGSSSSDYLAHGEYCLRIDRDDTTRFIACTDYINYPDYGAIWLISEDRQTLTYSHTEDDL
jgi:hypothetical protein